MEIEVLTLCDSAQNYQDKLIVVGTFNTIHSPVCPIAYPSFALACRFRYSKAEVGMKSFKLTFVAPDGQNVLPVMQTQINVPVDFEDYYASNLVIGFSSINFSQYGEYTINIETDDIIKHIPLFLKSSPQISNR